MTEKKTFKGSVDIDCRTDGWSVESWNDSISTQTGYDFFSTDEWDMEVTFTKKVKPVEAGQRRTYRAGSPSEELVTIIAVSGDHVWAATDPDSLYDSSWVTKLEWIS
jgi:hypothetical protein